MNILKLIVSHLTGWDMEIYAQTPTWNRRAMQARFFLLCIVASISGVSWGCLAWQLGFGYWAIAVGTAFSAYIFILDRIIVDADWGPHGILQRLGATVSWARRIQMGSRIGQAAVFCILTSMGAEMALFHQAILNQQTNSRFQHNQQITTTADATIAALKKQKLGSMETDHQRYVTIIADTSPKVDAARLAAAKAAEDERTAHAETVKELKGDHRQRGPGNRYLAEESRENAARADLVAANAAIALYQPKLDAAQKDLDATTAAYNAAVTELNPDIAKIRADMAQYVEPERNDILLMFVGLTQLYKDPVVGHEAWWFATLLMGVFMVIELSYVSVQIINPQACIYTAIKSQEAVVLFAKIEAKKQGEIRQARAAGGERPPLTIVGGSEMVKKPDQPEAKTG
jgi:hypothetical protein